MLLQLPLPYAVVQKLQLQQLPHTATRPALKLLRCSCPPGPCLYQAAPDGGMASRGHVLQLQFPLTLRGLVTKKASPS